MSITFDIIRYDEAADLYRPVCDANHGECLVAEHLLDEDIAAYSRPGWCVECSEVNRDACSLCNLSLNVGNASAVAIFERLGIEADSCGHFDPADFLGRVMVGNIGRDDSGVAAAVNGNMVDCGVRPGYYEDRFGALADLASEAVRLGALIGWG